MKNKVFMKLFWVYAIIVFLYTVITSGFFFIKNNEIVDLELKNNETMFFNQAVEHIETKIRVALSLVSQSASSEEINLYARDKGRNYYHITRVFNNLVGNTDAFDSFGFTINIVRQDDDLIITRFGTQTIAKHDKSMGISEKQRKEIEAYVERGDTGVHLIGETLRTDRGKMIMMVKREVIHGNVGIIFYINFFEEYLMPETEGDENGFALMKENIPIVYDTELEDGEMERLIAADETGSDGDHAVYRTRSGLLPDLHYLYVAPQNPLGDKQSPLLRDTAVVYLALLFFGLIFSFVAARNMYKPIRSIVNIMKGSGESGHQDEFSFIKETALRLKAANDKLNETLHRNRLPLRHKFLRDLLAGLAPADRVNAEISAHGLSALSGDALVVMLEFAEDRAWDEQFLKQTVHEIKSHAIDIVEERLRGEAEFEIVEWDYKRYAVILQGNDKDKAKKLIHQALSALEIDFDIRLVAAIGEPVSDAVRLHQSFQSAWKLLERRHAVDKRAVWTMENMLEGSEHHFYYTLDAERELISHVLQGKSEQVELILDRLFDDNLGQRSLSGEAFSRLMIAIVATISRILQQLNKSESDFFEEGELRALGQADIGEAHLIRERLKAVFRVMIEKMRRASQETDDGIADAMIEFVKENYNRDISLTDLAEHFNFSSGYISILFKNRIGTNFKDYLNVYRVDKAKALIDRGGRMTVGEIGEKVGFNHVNTFIRIFKKYEGVSPGQYVKNNE